MTRSARPNNWQDLLAGHALGNLSPEEAEILRQVLTDHPDLSAEVDRLQEVLAFMPYDLTEHEPPPHLRQQILAAAADASPLLFPAPPARRRNVRWLVGSAIAAVACLALAVENYRLRQEVESLRPIIATLQQPNAQLYALAGTQKAVGAAGSIVIAPDQRQVMVVVQQLPQLPQGRAYRLWAMPKNSQNPVFCGQFNTNLAGTITALWVVKAACDAAPTQLLITSESATAPPIPQGDLVMKSR